MNQIFELIESGVITPETAKTVQEIAKKLRGWNEPPSLEKALERFEYQKGLFESVGISLDAFLLRDFRLSEIFDAMEADEATQDDFWDAIFPSLDWCEYELKQLGFHSDYDKLHKIIEDANDNDDGYTVVPDTAFEYRTITDETDGLEHDECAKVLTALRYRKRYLEMSEWLGGTDGCVPVILQKSQFLSLETYINIEPIKVGLLKSIEQIALEVISIYGKDTDFSELASLNRSFITCKNIIEFDYEKCGSLTIQAAGSIYDDKWIIVDGIHRGLVLAVLLLSDRIGFQPIPANMII